MNLMEHKDTEKAAINHIKKVTGFQEVSPPKRDCHNCKWVRADKQLHTANRKYFCFRNPDVKFAVQGNSVCVNQELHEE